MRKPYMPFARCFAAFALALALSSCAANTSLTNRLNVKPVKAEGYVMVNEDKPGEDINIKDSLVFGRYTVMEFTSEYCPSCLQIQPYLKTLSMTRPDIAVRSFLIDRAGSDGIDWKSPLATRYNIHTVPGFIIFNDKGVKIADGDAARDQIKNVIQAENSH